MSLLIYEFLKKAKVKMKATAHKNSPNVGSINNLIGMKNTKIKTLGKQNQCDAFLMFETASICF